MTRSPDEEPQTILNPDNDVAHCLLQLAVRLTEQQALDANPHHASRWYWGRVGHMPQGNN